MLHLHNYFQLNIYFVFLCMWTVLYSIFYTYKGGGGGGGGGKVCTVYTVLYMSIVNTMLHNMYVYILCIYAEHCTVYTVYHIIYYMHCIYITI